MLLNLNPYLFFISFIIGLIVVFYTSPSPQIVMKFPTPMNAGKIVYKDFDNDSCYIYKAHKLDKCEQSAQKQPT